MQLVQAIHIHRLHHGPPKQSIGLVSSVLICSVAWLSVHREWCGKLRQQFESLLHELNLQAVLTKGGAVNLPGVEQGSSGDQPLSNSAFPSREAGLGAAGPLGMYGSSHRPHCAC